MTNITIIEPQVVSERSSEITNIDVSTTFDVIYIESKETVVVSDGSTPVVVESPTEIVVIEEPRIEVIPVHVGLPGLPGGVGVFISDVICPGGIVGDKEWDVSGKHLFAAKTDKSPVTVKALVSGGAKEYQPVVTMNGIPATVVETTTLRVFIATATVELVTGLNTVQVKSSSGGSSTVVMELLERGPDVLSAELVPPTAPQFSFRAGQSISFAVHTEDAATSIKVLAGGACASEAIATVLNGMATVNVIVSSVNANSSVSIVAYNEFGTPGETFVTELVPIDQVIPSVSLNVTYPTGHYAVALGEEFTLGTVAANFEEVIYNFPVDFVATPEYAVSKLLLSLSDTPEEILIIQATARKSANNSQSSGSVNVRVANVGPSLAISIDGNPQRLSRSPGGTVYTLRVSASQPLISLTVPGITLTPQAGRLVWTGTFRVYDTTPPGDMIISASARGAADHPSSQERTFIVGGFSSRTITWPAFSRVAPLGFSVYDQSHVSVMLGTKTLMRQEDATDRPNGFYIADANGSYNPSGSYIALSDVAFAGSNTTGTLQGTVSES